MAASKLYVPGTPIASKVNTGPIGYRANGSAVWPIAGGAPSPLAVASAQEQRVGRRPQTSEPVPGPGPFRRHTRPSRVSGFTRTFSGAGGGFGSTVNDPLKAVPGYLRWLDIRVTATGGTGTAAVAAADAPWNVIQNILLKDAFGQPILQINGFELFCLNIYSGQHGFWNASNPGALPSFTAVALTGNFELRLRLPLELFDGFASIPAANQSAIPSLTITLAASTAVYSTAPTTVPSLTISVQEAYYPIPLDDPNLAPPDNGSSCQWTQQRIPAGVASAAFNDLTLSPLGSFVTTLIFVGRDSGGVRVDTWLPAVTALIEFDIDGVPMWIEEVGSRFDEMFQEFGVVRPTGVIVYTFRDSEGPAGPVSDFDSGDGWLPTTPGSLLELKLTSQTIASAPATVDVISGRVYAAGGIPYTHLAE